MNLLYVPEKDSFPIEEVFGVSGCFNTVELMTVGFILVVTARGLT